MATNNTTLTDLVNNLKLLDRSDTAWNYERYSDLWEDLRKEFELEDRFETLEYKLNLVQHNVKFFLEILQNRKSDTLEWIIIILISGEILVSLWDIGTRLPGTGAAGGLDPGVRSFNLNLYCINNKPPRTPVGRQSPSPKPIELSGFRVMTSSVVCAGGPAPPSSSCTPKR